MPTMYRTDPGWFWKGFDLIKLGTLRNWTDRPEHTV